MTEQTVEQLMHERGITKNRAYVLHRELAAEANSVGASQSLADKILRILKNAPVKTIGDLQQALFFQTEEQHASSGDITRAVWSLQKRNLVTFYERKLGSNSVLTQIKLSRNGLRELGVVPSKEHLTPSKVKRTNELKRPSPVGKDMTESKNQPAVTNGGPVEVVVEAKKPEVIPSPNVGITNQRRILGLEPLPTNEKAEAPKDWLANLTNIQALTNRAAQKARYEATAEVLIDEGEDEAAERIMKKTTFTPLEEEVLLLVGRLP